MLLKPMKLKPFKKLEDEIAKRYPPESEKAKQLRNLKAQFDQSQKKPHEKASSSSFIYLKDIKTI